MFYKFQFGLKLLFTKSYILLYVFSWSSPDSSDLGSEGLFCPFKAEFGIGIVFPIYSFRPICE